MTEPDRVILHQRKRRLWFGGLLAWFCVWIVVKEFRDPPFDPVRVLVNLVLAVLLAWFMAWIFAKAMRSRR